MRPTPSTSVGRMGSWFRKRVVAQRVLEVGRLADQRAVLVEHRHRAEVVALVVDELQELEQRLRGGRLVLSRARQIEDARVHAQDREQVVDVARRVAGHLLGDGQLVLLEGAAQGAPGRCAARSSPRSRPAAPTRRARAASAWGGASRPAPRAAGQPAPGRQACRRTRRRRASRPSPPIGSIALDGHRPGSRRGDPLDAVLAHEHRAGRGGASVEGRWSVTASRGSCSRRSSPASRPPRRPPWGSRPSRSGAPRTGRCRRPSRPRRSGPTGETPPDRGAA